MSNKREKNSIYFDRKFARLGEHDIRTTSDGMHDDVIIVRSEPHAEYDQTTKIHDIAILYLEREIEFTGTFGKLKLAYF